MKIVIASDSFKGCLSSAEVADAVEEGILAVDSTAEIIKIPVADGGEGTVEALCGIKTDKRDKNTRLDAEGNCTISQATTCNLVQATVSDPLGRPVKATYGIIGGTAIIESAAACGLALLTREERNPLITSTRGLGELILDAIERGSTKFLIGLGGSATNDGGRGMLEVPGLLETIKKGIYRHKAVVKGHCEVDNKHFEATGNIQFTVACDVDTPFIGPDGASRVFAPQKGASPEDVEILEQRMQEYALKIQEDTGVDVRNISGAGAAGGLGGAFLAYFNAELKRGVDMVLDAIGFDELIRGADLVITGEGRSDSQTPKGKTPAGVLERARKQAIPVVLLSGAVIDCPELHAMGFSRILAATPTATNKRFSGSAPYSTSIDTLADPLNPLSPLNPLVAAANLRRAAAELYSQFNSTHP